MWVHVGDRGADMFPFFHACLATQTHFLVRAAQKRCVEHSDCEEEIRYSLDRARSWPSQASRPLEVPARHGHRARSTHVQLAFGQMTLLPPRNDRRVSQDPLTVWVIRVWQEQAPEGEEPLEWVLLTSVPTTRHCNKHGSASTGMSTGGWLKTLTNASKVGVALRNGNCKVLMA